MTFSESLQYLYSLGYETLAMKFGLRNTKVLLNALGNPQNAYLKVQIVGTNGKGSTAAFLDSITRAANIKTGLFTSPHLISVTERIKVDGKQISELEFAALTTEIREAAEKLIADGELTVLPTFFEHLTVIGLLAFARQNVEVAVLETGLGGRLDSVSAANAEFVGITPISLDHQEYLGDTLGEIAAEKAAALTPNVRAIAVAEQHSAEVKEIIEQECRKYNLAPLFVTANARIEEVNESGLITASLQTDRNNYENTVIGLRGRHQLQNAALAINLAEMLRKAGFGISQSAVRRGLAAAHHPGRLDLWTTSDGYSILFDGAHNPAGAAVLAAHLREFYSKTELTIVFGAMRDKDLSQMTTQIFPLTTKLVLTKPAHPRSAEPDSLKDFVHSKSNFYLTASVEEALQTTRTITDKDSLICITGSLYLVGEAQAILSNE